jgi:hypothetical protein
LNIQGLHLLEFSTPGDYLKLILCNQNSLNLSDNLIQRRDRSQPYVVIIKYIEHSYKQIQCFNLYMDKFMEIRKGNIERPLEGNNKIRLLFVCGS